MKKSKLLIISTLTLLTITACSNNQTVYNEKNTVLTQDATSVDFSTDYIDAFITLPSTNDNTDKNAVENFNEFYSNVESKFSSFINYEGTDMVFAQKEIFDEQFENFDLSHTSETVYEDDTLITVKRTEVFVTNETESTKYFAETFEKETGTLVLLSDIVSNTDLLIGEINFKIALSSTLDLDAETYLTSLEQVNFLVRDTGISFFSNENYNFNQTVNFEYISEILTEDYAYLGVNNDKK